MNKDSTFSLRGSRGRCLPHLNCRLLFLPILMKSGLRGRLGAPCKLVEFCWLGSVIDPSSVIPAPCVARKQCTAPTAGEPLLAEGTEQAGLDRAPDGHLPRP